MVISDLVTDREISEINSINAEKWCSCIDGALTKKELYRKYQTSRIY